MFASLTPCWWGRRLFQWGTLSARIVSPLSSSKWSACHQFPCSTLAHIIQLFDRLVLRGWFLNLGFGLKVKSEPWIWGFREKVNVGMKAKHRLAITPRHKNYPHFCLSPQLPDQAPNKAHLVNMTATSTSGDIKSTRIKQEFKIQINIYIDQSSFLYTQ